MILKVEYFDAIGDCAYTYFINPKAITIEEEDLIIDSIHFSLGETFDLIREVSMEDMLNHISEYNKGIEQKKEKE